MDNQNSMIFLLETEDAYLMQVDLPSVPMEIGEIVSKNHELTVKPSKAVLPNLLSLHTLGGKIKSFYQEGSLFVWLPKMGASPAVAIHPIA